MNTLTILGISGSLRAQSRNSGLLRYAAQCMPAGVCFTQADISAVPLYNQDIQDSGQTPDCVRTLVEQARRADAFLFACPEYNYSLAPALKNALDWISREPGKFFDNKSAALMGAGGTVGTARAQYHLRQVCVYLNLHMVNTPEIFSNAFSESFDEAGNVIDAEIQERIKAQVAALVDVCTRMRR